jgi:DNA-binding NtrC family response regulator
MKSAKRGGSHAPASGAAEAIRTLQSEAGSVELVFSDVRMQGEMDGFGLLRWVRDNREGMAVILTSGDLKNASAARELDEHANFVAKPYSLDTVLEAIRQALSANDMKLGNG